MGENSGMLLQAGPADMVKTVVGEPALYLLASVANLTLAIVIVMRARNARGALPLFLLCLSLFLWDICEAGMAIFETSHWKYVRLIGSSLAPVFLFHYVLHFVRVEEKYRRQLWLLYGFTALFSTITGGALFSEILRTFVDTAAWNVIYLVTLFPFLVFSMILLARRLRVSVDRMERNGLNLIGIGIGIGAFTGLADLTAILGGPLPPLGHIGGIAMAAVLALAIFRHRILETEIPFRQINVVLGVAAGAIFINFFLYRYVGSEAGDLLVLGSAVMIVVVLAVYRMILMGWYERREQQKRLAMLGTMAASVAHEIKNPLASIKGAAQYVQKELEDRPAGDDTLEYLKMMVDETDRLNQVVENFLDFAKPLAPNRQPVQMDKLLEEIIQLQRAAGGAEIEFNRDGAIHLSADASLLRHAISNILRNACESAGEKGKVTVRTQEISGARPALSIEIEDNGPGIPEDKMDDIFQPFFTTKTKGTGLGLAIARRILEGHNGTIRASSVKPHGAKFTLLLPVN